MPADRNHGLSMAESKESNTKAITLEPPSCSLLLVRLCAPSLHSLRFLKLSATPGHLGGHNDCSPWVYGCNELALVTTDPPQKKGFHLRKLVQHSLASPNMRMPRVPVQRSNGVNLVALTFAITFCDGLYTPPARWSSRDRSTNNLQHMQRCQEE